MGKNKQRGSVQLTSPQVQLAESKVAVSSSKLSPQSTTQIGAPESGDDGRNEGLSMCFVLKHCLSCLWITMGVMFVLTLIGPFVSDFMLQVSLPAQAVAAPVASIELEGSLIASVFAEAGSQMVPRATPGEMLQAEGLSRRHPLVFLPGIVSTPLEVWKGVRCMKNYLRQRIWGEGLMLQKILLNPSCWLDHIRLNASTGLDPDDIKLRPSTGLKALESLAGAYTLWAPLINSAAVLGYDETSMHMASYDWRVSFHSLEDRDWYFSRLKTAVEQLYSINDNHRVVVVAHSMGALVWLYFQQWVHSSPAHMALSFDALSCNPDACIKPPSCGVLGADNVTASWMNHQQYCAGCRCRYESWTDKYVEAFLDVAGPLLGLPKALAAVVSGEMHDTAEMPAIFSILKETVLSRSDLRDTFRSFGSMASMLPLGGDRIWGGSNASRSSGASDFKPLLRRHTTFAAALDQEIGIGDVSRIITIHYSSARSEPSASTNETSSNFFQKLEKIRVKLRAAIQNRNQTIAQAVSAFLYGSRLEPPQEMPAAGADTKSSAANPSTIVPPYSSMANCTAAIRHYILSDAFGVLDPVVQTCTDSDSTADIVERILNETDKVDHGITSTFRVQPREALRADLEELRSAAVQLTVEQAFAALQQSAPAYMLFVESVLNVSAGHPSEAPGGAFAGGKPRQYWPNPLSSVLPRAPTTKIACMYGVGKLTERAYQYSGGTNESLSSDSPLDGSKILNTISSADAAVSHGVQLVDGDGTVPIVSLGYMCVRGWMDPARNPSGSPLLVREYRASATDTMPRNSRASPGSIEVPDAVEFADSEIGALASTEQSTDAKAFVKQVARTMFDVSHALAQHGIVQGGLNLLRGEASGDHVDILLNSEFIEDVLRVACGHVSDVDERVHSNIRTYASRASAGV